MVENASIFGSYLWVGITVLAAAVGLLYGLTRHVSRALAWSLVGVVVTAPLAFYFGTTSVMGSLCSENVRFSGQSHDAEYSYVIQMRECGPDKDPKHVVKIGRNRDFMQMHKVFESVGDVRPQAVVQRSDHEFMITMAPKAGWDNSPLVIRIDPDTGYPADSIQYVAH